MITATHPSAELSQPIKSVLAVLSDVGHSLLFPVCRHVAVLDWQPSLQIWKPRELSRNTNHAGLLCTPQSQRLKLPTGKKGAT
jgi:hypothetical protein